MKILICGDYIVYDDGLKKNENPFGEFTNIIKAADISIYNQEFPITKSKTYYPTKKYGLLAKTDPGLIYQLASAGFNCATLANNHIFNYAMPGLRDTFFNLKKVGISYVGAGENIAEASKPLIFNKDNETIVILNFTENEFNIATETHGGANPLNIVSVIKQIKAAKKLSKNVFLIIHGGIDFCKIPSPRIIELYRFFADFGVTAIIGHHSHVVSGYEVYNEVPIFYGIGNFIPGKVVHKDVLYSFPVEFEINEHSKLKFKGYPLKFNPVEQQLELIVGKEYDKFIQEQKNISEKLNDIHRIKDDLMNNFLTKEKESYYFTLFTRSNYFLFKVFRKIGMIKLYHTYISRKMKLNKRNSAMWDIFRCDSHHDVLNLIYEKHIDLYKNN